MRRFKETINVFDNEANNITVIWTEEQLKAIYNGDDESYIMYGPEDGQTFEEYVHDLCIYGPLEEITDD